MESNDFAKTLYSLGPKNGLIAVFDDFLELCLCAISFVPNEQQFLNIVAKYGKDEVRTLADAFGLLDWQHYEAKINGVYEDYLGDFFMAYNGKKTAQDKGQFFTPANVCVMMAQMISDRSYERIADPACGSGRTLTSHAFYSPHAATNLYWGCDFDSRCVKMTALSMFLFRMNGVVIHANSLSNRHKDVYSGWRIMPINGQFGVYQLTQEEAAELSLGNVIKHSLENQS